MLLKRMSKHEQANKVNKELEGYWDYAKNNQPFLKNMNIPSDLNDIQPRVAQVWNCEKLGLIIMQYGTRSSVLTSYFKVNKCER